MDPKVSKSQENEPKRSNRSPPYAAFNLVVILVAIAYGIYYQMYLKEAEVSQPIGTEQNDFTIPMFTADELKKYNGEGKVNCYATFVDPFHFYFG